MGAYLMPERNSDQYGPRPEPSKNFGPERPPSPQGLQKNQAFGGIIRGPIVIISGMRRDGESSKYAQKDLQLPLYLLDLYPYFEDDLLSLEVPLFSKNGSLSRISRHTIILKSSQPHP